MNTTNTLEQTCIDLALGEYERTIAEAHGWTDEQIRLAAEHNAWDAARDRASNFFKWLASFAAPVEKNFEGWAEPEPLDNYERPPFPIEAMPSDIATFIRALSVETSTRLDVAGMTVLGAVALLASRKVDVIRPWHEPTNLYVCVVAESGERKSPVFTKAFSPISSIEERHEIDTRAERMAAKAARANRIKYHGAQANAEIKAGNMDAAATERTLELQAKGEPEPVPPRLLAADVTPEAIVGLLAAHGGRIGVKSDEGGIFDTIAGRYASGVPNLDAWLKGHDGSDDIIVDRVGRESEYVKRPAITAVILTQPEVLQKIGNNQDFKGRGFSYRWLWAVPGSDIGYRPVEVEHVPENVMWQYVRRLDAVDEISELHLSLDAEALELFNGFREKHEVRLRAEGDLASIRGWASKHPGSLLRIAALLHVLDPDRTARGDIGVDTMRLALMFSDYLIAHARIALDALGMSTAHTSAVRVLAWIKAEHQPTFSQRDCSRDLHLDAPVLVPGLDLLVDKGYLRRETLPAQEGAKGGGRPSIRYEVWPGLLAK